MGMTRCFWSGNGAIGDRVTSWSGSWSWNYQLSVSLTSQAVLIAVMPDAGEPDTGFQLCGANKLYEVTAIAGLCGSSQIQLYKNQPFFFSAPADPPGYPMVPSVICMSLSRTDARVGKPYPKPEITGLGALRFEQHRRLCITEAATLKFSSFFLF